jgi:hypothetical protein
MASSTIGRLYGGDYAVNKLRVAAAPISGAGQNRLFDTGDFPLVVNGNWQRVTLLPLSGMGDVASITPSVCGPFLQEYLGVYQISGQTQLAGVPFRALVHLYPDRVPTLPVRSTFTDASGVYSFTDLAPGRYLVLGIDASGTYNAVVWDIVDAVPM